MTETSRCEGVFFPLRFSPRVPASNFQLRFFREGPSLYCSIIRDSTGTYAIVVFLKNASTPRVNGSMHAPSPSLLVQLHLVPGGARKSIYIGK